MAKSIEAQRLPYVSFTTWTRLLDKLRAGELPSHIDTSMLVPLAFSGSTSSALRTALRFLGLITDAGVPTDRLRQLLAAEGKDRQNICGKLLGNYKDLGDLGRATPSDLNDYLRKQGASGDSTRKCAAFLLGLARDANISTPHLRSAAVGRKSPRKSLTVKKAADEKARQLQFPDPPPLPTDSRTPPPPPSHHHLALLELFLKKYPDFDHTRPESDKKDWHLGYQSMFQTIFGPPRDGRNPEDPASPI